MKNISLARALTYKKRVVESLRKLDEGTKPETDIKLALQQREGLVKHLILLKLTLMEATKKIQEKIFELGEAKSEISIYQGLNTTSGRVRQHSYREGDSVITFTAVISKQEKDKTVKALQEKIDNLQQEIDAHNNTTKIEIPEMDLP